ncbi:hypothetical protein [Clostridium folliculivorans]|nr:hypothetical protein [Clostridium folliculivorans]
MKIKLKDIIYNVLTIKIIDASHKIAVSKTILYCFNKKTMK